MLQTCYTCHGKFECSCLGQDVLNSKMLKNLPCFENNKDEHEPRSILYELKHIHFCSERCAMGLPGRVEKLLEKSGLKEVRYQKYSSWYDPSKKTEDQVLRELKRRYLLEN